ncbi:MAG: flagellar biosynthesis protein FlhA [Spirochaetia bacterium]|nr:flagellar biosynthesis protein FlhA [Spirochaetia bacterium]
MNEILENLKKNLNNSDIILGVGVIFILALIVIPLPGVILDGLITLSLLAGMLGSKSPADFTVFPTLLLITTVYRLAVNISTTRMILTKGESSDSAMIDAFGSFVIGGGNAGAYLIGIILFIILTLVQILVITKGATRVSEVAARFALDSLPGKQLAIDSDLAAGYIDDREARRRRESLQKEMAFYGAMDGASKFVQGDVRLGLVITVINIIGGLIVGMSIRGEPFSEALEIYTRFTIGDGLVSQIPALLISSATGIIVSRSVSEDALTLEIKDQLFANPQILYVVGGVLILSGFIPGFPTVALFLIGGFFVYLATRIDKEKRTALSSKAEGEGGEGDDKKPESYLQHLHTEPLEVEIGYNLIPLVDPKSGGTLLDQISRLRRRFAMESGLIVPPVRIRDNMNLSPGEYIIRLHGSIIAGANLEPEKLMAIDTGRTSAPIEGATQFQEPTYNLNAYWIDPEQKGDAEASGYDVVDTSTVIATHLSSVIQQNSQEIMGRQEIKSIIDSLREDNSVIVDEVLIDKKITIGQIQAVLQNLLKEGVSIRNMVRVLEGISNHAEKTHGDPYLLTEAVRQHLGRQIAADFMDENKKIKCIVIEPNIERRLREGIHRDPEEGFVMALRPEFQTAVRDALSDTFQKALSEGHSHPVFLCSRPIRAGVFYILERLFPNKNFAVLAHDEVPSDAGVDVIGEVTLEKKESEEVAVS